MGISKELLDVLACPVCKMDVKYYKKKNREYLKCVKCGKEYEIKDGIPVMLV